MKKFNINCFVKVQLNKKGKDIYIHRYDNLPKEYREGLDEDIDKDGFIKIQLWEFMNLFGKYMVMGAELPFEHMNIFFNDIDLVEVEE